MQAAAQVPFEIYTTCHHKPEIHNLLTPEKGDLSVHTCDFFLREGTMKGVHWSLITKNKHNKNKQLGINIGS